MTCCQPIPPHRYVPPFAGFTEFTASIPKLYFNVKSQEQRIHAMCELINKLICYADMLGDKVSDDHDAIEELIEAINSVWQGQQYVSPLVTDILHEGQARSVVLTEVEKNILRLICDGLTNPQIAVQLGLSTETVNWYRKRLLAKFEVKNSVGLVRKVLEQKLL